MKKILITGDSKGIGKAISEKLQKNYEIVGVSRSPGDRISVDLNDLTTLPENLKNLTKKHPDVEAIICNAGRGHFSNLEEFSFEQISSLINLNLISHIFLVKAFLPLLKKRQKGNIIFIGSEASLKGKKKGSVYCASKFGIRGFAQALRDECANDHIRVTIINPGMVKTPFFHSLNIEPGDSPDEHILPEDIASIINTIIESRDGTVFDEINISPQKRMITFKH